MRLNRSQILRHFRLRSQFILCNSDIVKNSVQKTSFCITIVCALLILEQNPFFFLTCLRKIIAPSSFSTNNTSHFTFQKLSTNHPTEAVSLAQSISQLHDLQFRLVLLNFFFQFFFFFFFFFLFQISTFAASAYSVLYVRQQSTSLRLD